MASTIPRPLRALLAGLLLGALLAGCSGRAFFYNRLDVILPWYLERYVDLDPAQADAFDLQVDALLTWHRREELPRYLALVDAAEVRLEPPVSAADVVAVTDDLEAAWYRLRDRALEELLVLGATLSDAQIGEFLASLDKRQRKYERKYLGRSDAEYREDAEDNLRDLLEDFLGPLTRQQQQRLADAAGALRRSDSAWLSERARWTAMLRRELLREPGWQRRLREEIYAWEERLPAAVADLYEHNTQVVQAAMADVLDARSERQAARLARELEGWRELIARLTRPD
jgi:hypothetical protein